MDIWPLLSAARVGSSPAMGTLCQTPMPLRTPLTASWPKGPASKVAGGRFCSGPVMEGVGSAAGGVAAAGAGFVSAGLAGLGSVALADFGSAVLGVSGGACAQQSAVSERQRTGI